MTQKGPSSYPDKEMFPEKEEQPNTSSEGSFSIPKQSPQHPSEESPPNIRNTRKCSVKKSYKDYLNIPSGITQLNCYQELLHHYPDGSSLLPKARSLKHKNS